LVPVAPNRFSRPSHAPPHHHSKPNPTAHRRSQPPDPPPHAAQTYILKLSKSGSEGEKVFLLLESGSRLHTVQVRGAAVLALPLRPCARFTLLLPYT